MPSLGRAPGVGRVGGNCQQLPGGKLVYRQQPDWRLRQARASRSRPPSSRLAGAQTLHPTAGALRRDNSTNKETREASRQLGDFPGGQTTTHRTPTPADEASTQNQLQIPRKCSPCPTLKSFTKHTLKNPSVGLETRQPPK